MLSDKEKELVEVIQLAYRKLYLKDENLSRAIVESVMVRVMKKTLGDKSFETWARRTRFELGYIR